MKRGCRTPWLALGLPVFLLLLCCGAWVLQTLPVRLTACPMKLYLGIPCATCGLTRCVVALSAGHWAEAFHWHPVAVVLGLAAPFAMGWDLHRAWLRAPYPVLSDSLAARLIVAGLLAATWILQIARGI